MFTKAVDLIVLITSVAARPKAHLVLILLAASLSWSCVYALGPQHLIDGTPFPTDEVDTVERGMSEEQVSARLGPPREASTRGDRVVWHYYSVQQLRGCAVRLFGFIPLRGYPTQTDEAQIVFEGGHVIDVKSLTRDGRKDPKLG